MNRREALKQVAVLMGGAVSAPAILGVLNGCTARQGTVDWKPVFLTPEQSALVAEVAEIIIPRTDTPGAKDVGVPQFIDTMLHAVYAKDAQERFVSGLQAFEAEARKEYGRPFLRLDPAQQSQLVRKVQDAAIEAERADKAPDRSSRRPFILMTRELTLLGFFTSEVGASQVLQWVAVPGAWHPCIPIAQAGNGRAWALEGPPRL